MKELIIISIISQIVSFPFITKAKRNLQEKKSNDIVILHTNDVHCGVIDTIGYDGLMLYKKQLLKKYNNVILVDAGDHIEGGTIGTITNGDAIIDIMNKLEYDVVTLGNHEFDYKIPQLEELEKKLNCGYISINYCFHKNKTSRYNASKIIEKGGKKIGFIGVATPQTLSKTYLNSFYDSDGNKVYDFLTENKSKELYNRIQEEIDKLKNIDKVDYIILLGHLGIYGDASEENTSAGIIKNIKDVVAFIDGHTHQIYSQYISDKNSKNVILAQTGTKLTNIGVLIIHENGAISHKNINDIPYDPNLASETLTITRNKKYYVDKEMNNFIKKLYESFSEQLNKVIGYTPFSLSINTKSGENILSNLICDSFKEIGNADISIMNVGAVRNYINKGDITYQEVIDAMPFSNDVEIKQINGQTILDALEYGVKSLPYQASRFPQVSGITFKVDQSINSPVILDKDENFKSVNGERRVYDVKINGKNLDINKKYTISSNSFILNGGDGYTMFSPFETINTAIGLDNEIVIKYISENLKGVIPSKYQKNENRIIITNGKILKNIKPIKSIDYIDSKDPIDSSDSIEKDYSNKSSGYKIALIIVVPIVVLIIIISSICCLKKRKRKINKIRDMQNVPQVFSRFTNS